MTEGHRALRLGEEYADKSRFRLPPDPLDRIHSKVTWRRRAYGELAVQQAPTPADRGWSEGNLAWARCRAGESAACRCWLRTPPRALIRFVWGELSVPCVGNMGQPVSTTAPGKPRRILEPAGSAGCVSPSRHCLWKSPWQPTLPSARHHWLRPISSAALLCCNRSAENELALTTLVTGRLHQRQRSGAGACLSDACLSTSSVWDAARMTGRSCWRPGGRAGAGPA